MTISEMAQELGLARKTVEMRLLRRGHKPISYEAIYDTKAFEDIKNTPGKGRPRKSPQNNVDITQQYNNEKPHQLRGSRKPPTDPAGT